jgi:hypothetical protein
MMPAILSLALCLEDGWEPEALSFIAMCKVFYAHRQRNTSPPAAVVANLDKNGNDIRHETQFIF